MDVLPIPPIIPCHHSRQIIWRLANTPGVISSVATIYSRNRFGTVCILCKNIFLYLVCFLYGFLYSFVGMYYQPWYKNISVLVPDLNITF